MRPERLERTSADGSKLNLEALYQIAPSCFTECEDRRVESGVINVEKDGRQVRMAVNFTTLRQLLGDNAVEDGEEMYQFIWPGKQAARREAATPITDTLRPVPEDSVDWDTTQNLYIEGDNLRVLKLLQKGYMGTVKMIYIDPPYNTGNDFVYHDDFAHSLEEEELAVGNVDEEGNRYRKNLDSNGRFHSDWCSMMYSRLLVAHSLLKEDGVIFISIDDNEICNLQKICNEIYGEKNFVTSLVWQKKTGASDAKGIAIITENILVYCKNKELYANTFSKNKASYDVKRYKFKDEFYEERGPYYIDNLDRGGLSYSESLNYGIECPDGTITYPNGRLDYKNDGWIWKWGQKKIEWARTNKFIEFRKSPNKLSKWSVCYKNYLYVDNEGNKIKRAAPHKNLITDILNADAASIMKELFKTNNYFNYSKPIELIKRLLEFVNNDNSIILDFFSGSATTAHAVMQLNADDSGHRKYICVQLAEETPEDSEARKAGYNTIPEIAKERIRRAGKKIKDESPLTTQDLDTGFRVFRLADSNYENVEKSPNEYDQNTLDLFADNIKADRTDLDLLFGAMLSWGVQLSLPMTTEEVDGCKIYTVDGNDLVACFAENITENVVKAMAAKQPQRVLFRDSCFGEDKTKINIFELFKQQLNWDESQAVNSIRVI